MRLSSDNMHASAAVESSPPELEVPRDPRLGSFEFVEPDSRSMCTCSWLGMSPEARAGWNLIHVKTDVIRIAYMAAVTGTVVTSAVLYGGGFPLITLRVHIPSFLNWLAYLFLVGQILRGGPLASNTNKYKGVVVVYIGSLSYLTVASFVGPIWYTPFKNRLVNVALTAAQLLFMGCSAAFGGTADDIPAKPYQSLWWPFTNSAFTTMRIRDVLTDFGFARILLDQGPPCMWFAKPVPCSHYTRLAVAVGVMSLANLLIVWLVLVSGGTMLLFNRTGSWSKATVTANAAVMLLELGGILVALLKVFSDMRLARSSDSSRLRSEAAFAIISCCVTMASFAVNVIGMQKVLQAVRDASVRFLVRVSGHGGPMTASVRPAASHSDSPASDV